MAEEKNPSPPADPERQEEARDQLKDLMALVERDDPSLSRWERDFLGPLGQAKRVSLTCAQADKINQIYEQKYLRGTYGGKRNFAGRRR